ncbi:MAG: type I-E CRISPR-associated protein Cse2/CasB [Acidobacteriota bacterium]|nr:type I-E CRISPR-associated protein Cse2/CasB [Acidobacteriota bacterium]
MSEQETKILTIDEKFINHLEGYVEKENRAALAHLRRGLGKEPGTAMEMFPYVTSWVTTNYNEKPYFLIAALIGLYPKKSWNKYDRYNNLGKSLAEIEDGSKGVEKRFTALLNANEEDLPEHLRQAVSLLKSKDKNINWFLLLKDIKNWSYESKYVQKSWAKGFWGKQNKEKGEEK